MGPAPGVDAKRITDAALTRLMHFDFPGNVRQLENICHWLTVMAPAQMVEAKDLPPELLGTAAIAAVPPLAVAEAPVSVAALAVAEAPQRPVLPESSASVASNSAGAPGGQWLNGLELDARGMLLAGVPDVWDALTRKFEAQLIHTALEITRGRRIEAAQKLGIGRNTITRKIQELGLDE